MIEKYLENVVGLANDIKNVNERKAYACGYDSGKNGPNIHNCHFSLFSCPSLTKAWERGNQDAQIN